MGQMIDIRDLDGVVMDMVDPMATGSLFRRVHQRNANNRYYNGLVADQENSTLMDLQREAALRANAGYRPNEAAPNRSFTAADLSTANPDFKAYSHVPFDDGINRPSAYEFLNGLNTVANATLNQPEVGLGLPTKADTQGQNVADKGGVGEETNAEHKTDLYRVIQSELQSLDDGMSLTGAERMVQAFDQIFAKYENADAEIANMFLGKNNVRKETAYSPFLGR